MDGSSFFTILDSVDSTNNYAMAAIENGTAGHGMACFAHEQTAGRGQRGKHWASQKGKNIMMSLILEPRLLKMTSQFHLSAVIANACSLFLSELTGEKINIKWPNDLFWCDRKTGGILIENKFQGSLWKWAVAGIGINVNQVDFDRNLLHAVSLKQVTGKNFNCADLARQLQERILEKTADDKELDKVLQQYNEQLYKRNELVTLRKGRIKFDTKIKEVSARGRLVTTDSLEREFDFGEVEWVL